MKPSNVKKALRTAVKAKRPVFVKGKPGVGKSQVIHQLAQEEGMELRDVRAILLDPVDLRGLPTVVKGEAGGLQTAWAAPSFLPTEGDGILFLDELNAAPQSVQAACYQLILDRALGEYRLPDGWAVIAAGNGEGDRAVVNRMPAPLANRFMHLEFEVDLEDWTRWALQNGAPTELVAFIRFRPELLHHFDPQSKEAAFPSPRTWAFVGEILAARPDPEVEHEMYAGLVGQGPAAEFTGFLRIFRNLPNPDTVLLNPDTAPVPNDPATLYALAGALARKATPDNFARVVQYAGRMPAEYGVVMVRDAVSAKAEVRNTRAFIEWVARNSDVLM